MAGNGLKWIELLKISGNGLTWLEIGGHGFKRDGLLQILEIWGVWDMKIGGLGDFLLGPAQPGVLV